jgi:hypothetical protein
MNVKKLFSWIRFLGYYIIATYFTTNNEHSKSKTYK